MTSNCSYLLTSLSMAISPPHTICFSSYTKEDQEKDELIYQNYEKVISTLPKSSGTHLHTFLFKSFWFHDGGSTLNQNILQGIMAARDHFISRPGDILLATLPKVGTTWLKSLAFAMLNRNDHPYPQSYLLTLNPHECVPTLEYQLYTNYRIPNLDVLPSPRLLATHMPYSVLPPSVLENERCKIVYLCRSPKDMMISMWKFANNLIPEGTEPLRLDTMVERYISGKDLSGPFWDNMIEYWKASIEMPNRVLFLRYEDLKKEPNAQVRRFAEFMGCGFSMEEEDEGVVEKIVKMCSLETLKGLEVNQTKKTTMWKVEYVNKAFFRKGVVGDWVNYMSSVMAEKVEKVTKEKIEGTGLSFE